MKKLIMPPKTERLFKKNPFLFTRGHDFVEIGGIKWATCNIGAEKPTDTGLYFQWGDTKGYSAEQVRNHEKRFNWHNYSINKYNEIDDKTVLDIEDDAVHFIWGGAWRMPTIEELAILCRSKTFWTDNYQGSGMPGMVLTDRTNSSKELFLPAAGTCRNGAVNYRGYIGYYLSKTLNKCFGDCYDYCYNVTFTNLCKPLIRLNDQCRCHGQTIRGVLDI